jgi:hypothetical protein
VTDIRFRGEDHGIPLVELSGTFTETGTELADRIMRVIYLATDSDEYRHPLSLPVACVRAPREP